jgi:hypothetical protein
MKKQEKTMVECSKSSRALIQSLKKQTKLPIWVLVDGALQYLANDWKHAAVSFIDGYPIRKS